MTSFYDRRGDEIVYNVFIFIVVILLSFIFIGLGYSNRIQWAQDRCNPFLLPFSSTENLNYCVQNIMSETINQSLYPFQFLLSTFATQMSTVAEGANNVRNIGNQVRSGITNSTTDIMSRVVNLTVPLQQSIISSKDVLEKTEGVLTTGLYSGLGTYYTLKSSMGVVINSSIKTMIIMLAVMIPLLSNPFTAMFALPMVAAFTAISVLIIPIVEQMSKDMGIKPDVGVPKLKIPKPRLCFNHNTKIKLRNGNIKKIENIVSGDVLLHDGVVQSTMSLLGNTEQMYKIGKTIVSGSHIIYDNVNNQWIPVKRHKLARRINNMTNILYCLVTSQRTITDVNGNIFKDWNDDIELFEHYKMNYYNPDTWISIGGNLIKLKHITPGTYLNDDNLCVGVVKSLIGMQLITTHKSFDIFTDTLITVGDYDDNAEK
jgi:hypothetical protein